jgi:hyperosmotically inducible periplasmic protein
MRKLLLVLTILVLGIGSGFGSQPRKGDLTSIHDRLSREVRRQLMLLSNYTVFDNLEFTITGADTINLAGQVTRPTLKRDAETAVQSVEGVGNIVNQIEVLPLSADDDRIRMATLRSIYSKPGLDRYAAMAIPSIHIIVKNGKVTLVGVVASEGDKELAGLSAKGVSGAFEVVNNLRIEKKAEIKSKKGSDKSKSSP